MIQRKIYVVGGDYTYANWMEGKLTKVMEEAHLVVFTGGEDVTPTFYEDFCNPHTYFNHKRDGREILEFTKARSLNKHMVGICRGSQFLCVMSGGRLVQDQNNPHYIHPITLSNGQVIDITSTHHQAAYPFDMDEADYKILGWTTDLCGWHEDGREREMYPPKECEIVYYPKTQCLGIQGHPEHMWREKEKYKATFSYLQPLLTNFLNNKL